MTLNAERFPAHTTRDMGKAEQPSSRRSAPSSGAPRVSPPGPAVGSSPQLEPDITRLGIPVNADGSLAADRMRPTTREALRKLVTDPATTKALGVDNVAPDVASLSPAMSSAIASAIAEIDLAIVQRATKAPQAIMDQVRWSEVEIALTATPAGRIVSKYGGAWLSRFDDEIALLVLLFTITQVKIAMARQLMIDQKGAPRVVPFPSNASPALNADPLDAAPHNQPDAGSL